MCPHRVKLEQRPNLDCKLKFGLGDRVLIAPNLERCVVSVNEKIQEVAVDVLDKPRFKKFSYHQLQLPESTTRCTLPHMKKVVSSTPLAAAADAPHQVSVCDNVTIHSYQSTNSGPLTQLKYRWIMSKADRAKVFRQQDAPALMFTHLAVGEHVFSLEVRNQARATAHSANLTVSVVPKPAPKVDLSCPPSTCTRTANGVYEFEVNLGENNALELDVRPAKKCKGEASKVKEELQIVWEQRTTKPGEASWEPLQVGHLNNKNRWLNIAPYALHPCLTTELRVSVKQPSLTSENMVLIRLKPRQVALVVKAESNTFRAGYHDEIVLSADVRNDPLARFYPRETLLDPSVGQVDHCVCM